MIGEARKVASRPASTSQLPASPVPWMMPMFATVQTSLQVSEAVGRAWLGFLGERSKCWGAFRDDLSRCSSIEDAMTLHASYLTEMGRAYVEVTTGLSAAAGKALSDDKAEVPPPPSEERRAA